MTGKRVAALFRRHLRAHLPGMEQRGSLVYERPLGGILRGCHFESSAFEPERFAVHAFVQPLYQPATSVVLHWGDRLGMRVNRWFDLAAEGENAVGAELLDLIRIQALPFFAKFHTPADFARHAPAMGWSADDPYLAEAMAYSLALCGNHGEAGAWLARLPALLPAADLLPYQREMIRRNARFAARLQDRPEDALADLRTWRRETLRAIGLKDDQVPEVP